ncbi:MAG TPA: tRNA epoxyqueuosine(34) reductase QueG [Verrucomicrobiae bacterium]|nr:tRNA epoxyqueuosine(34) reductase QueG [Verrucomicrobiae bacterium]
MKAQIRARALELGFDDCRFTSANPPHSAEQFQKWITEKNFGEMSWLERNAEKRIKPQKVLLEAKSVICLVMNYFKSDKQQVTSDKQTATGHSTPLIPSFSSLNGEKVSEGRLRGIVARYARFDDYHNILSERLKLLTQFINESGGAEAKSLWYVDTGPILERDLAQRAGIGFVGKHTNLISRKSGNWIFLAEILTTLELEPDAPEKNHCGKCTRCLDACPTNAITAPFELDARKCISYLTIELKGSIPVEFRRAIGNRIYGCDDCLAACPWNKFAREGNLMRSHLRKDLEQPDLIELLSLDEMNFKTRFANSPILRTKRRGFLRNVCVALGNIGDKSVLPHLQKAANDSEELIREHAHWAISEIEARGK